MSWRLREETQPIKGSIEPIDHRWNICLYVCKYVGMVMLIFTGLGCTGYIDVAILHRATPE